MRASIVWIAGVAAACGSGKKTNNVDAPNVAAMLTISGTATTTGLSGTMPVSGVAVGAYDASSSSGTALVSTMTDANGNFTLMVPTGGKPVDGYLKATDSGYVDTYLWPPAPLTMDFSKASINILTTSNFNLLANTLCSANQSTTKGTIAVLVEDGAAMPAAVAGATVSASPAASNYCYDQGNPSFPNRSATATDSDGLAFMFNVTGQTMVSASKSGATFKTHTINAVAGAFTTTIITE